ncbi:hypothetical protein BKA67DRAFT_659596 [Truncatella angustata]|uniref:RanBD1 domain-containing protein n=1 Tax=Truncatella angustata TaxID=152316 RepID=A0A9P8UIE9_9PEZI|nr:uncharacterized protein BKA67DRAFT_659596 [Truncatella angustata]KAH6652943.1 hypothetical protein BKA67DRAFT_659596 [Truncatella angustata]
MSASFNPKPTPRRTSAAPGSHSSITPAANRFRSSLVPMRRASPLRSSHGPSRVTTAPAPSASGATSASASGAPIVKDLFRTETTPRPSRITPFAPRLPAEATKTPASIRKLAPKGAQTGMAGTAPQELFKQRIPDPDEGLTGLEISNAVPSHLKNRKGTVYADQYLAHKCPPEFDDDQRRQFFCILDLRRLKYAANEIFAKKDWKLNIINFAKEYEKSRGLIMLRYGLYEFKNVKPSEEVMRKWRKAHGLPEPEPESRNATTTTTNITPSAPFGNTASKTDENAQRKGNALQTSIFNQNKKRSADHESTAEIPRFAPSPFKKRKAVEADEDDENERNNPKKATPSAARSKLEGIINNVQSASSTPVGSPAKKPTFGASASTTTGTTMPPLFGVTKPDDGPKSVFATKSNPYAAPSNGVVDSLKLNSTHFQPGQALNGAKDSVLGSHKFGSGLAPKAGNIFGYLSESSANNSGAENGDDTDSESGESQPETGSQDAAPSAVASTGTATPPVAGSGGSLFGFNKPAAPASNPFASVFNKPAETIPEKPVDDTKGGLFGRVSFGANGQPLRETSVEETPRASSPVKEAAAETEQTETPAKGPGDFTFNPASTPIVFGKSDSSVPSQPAAPAADETASELKKSENGPASSSSSLFGNSLFKPATGADSPKPLFGIKPAEQPSQPLFGVKPPEQSSQPLFGAKPADQPATTTQQTSQPLFGNFSKPAEPEQPAPTPSAGTLFGAKSPDSTSQQPSGSLFSSLQKPAEKETTETATAPTTSSIFNTQPAPSASFSFGGAPTSKPLFGQADHSMEAQAPDQEPPKSLFGSQGGFGAPSTVNGDVTVKKEPTQNAFGSQPLFGKPSTETSASTPAPAPLFGGFQSSTEPPKPASNLFGNNTTSSSSNLFGNNSSSTPANLFGAAPANPFASAGSTSNKRSAEDDLQPAKKVMFGRPDENGNTASQPASSSFTFGASQPAAPSNDQPEKKTMFGNVTGEAAGSPVPGRKILTPKRLRGAGGAARQASPSPAPSFEGSGMFGSQTPKPDVAASANSFGNSNASFAFGQQSDAPTGGNHSSFTFGQSSSQPNGAPAGGSSFTFGGSSAAPATGSFTFGAGGDVSSNPFGGASGPPTQSFGAASGTPTPAGSFNFQFGGQSSSAPAPADQGKPLFGGQPNANASAPTFSFTSATPQSTPQQSSTNLFAPQPSAPSIFSGLQPGGSAPGANSPFPAGSSMNTTPVSGTPEPQTQQADGDAEPPQEQISLTQGGPGEEDEDVVFDVRAKAMRYVTVDPGEDSPASKSPWQTRGIGPLRLLKHKTTGAVRILLRAEPSGNVAMNKALLPNVAYKADKKTVKVMTSNDDGSGLETWVLQVKKPENATELASALESWKASNK